VQINIKLSDTAPPQAILQPLKFDQALIPVWQPVAKLSDLPVKLSLRQTAPDTWNLEIPANVVALLLDQRKRSIYTGTLTLDEPARKMIPLKLVLEEKREAPPKKRAHRKSAG
jgi:hypothetical protein